MQPYKCDEVKGCDQCDSYKPVQSDSSLPRRCQLNLNTPAELAIRNAISEVEKLPADIILTDAIIQLASALKLVADYVDAHGNG